jgi:hypothetical protein
MSLKNVDQWGISLHLPPKLFRLIYEPPTQNLLPQSILTYALIPDSLFLIYLSVVSCPLSPLYLSPSQVSTWRKLIIPQPIHEPLGSRPRGLTFFGDNHSSGLVF